MAIERIEESLARVRVDPGDSRSVAFIKKRVRIGGFEAAVKEI